MTQSFDSGSSSYHNTPETETATATVTAIEMTIDKPEQEDHQDTHREESEGSSFANDESKQDGNAPQPSSDASLFGRKRKQQQQQLDISKEGDINVSSLPRGGDDEEDEEDRTALLFDEENASLHAVFHEWAQTSSMHGVAEISDYKRWKAWKRLLWLILVCASSYFMVAQILILVDEYKDYAVIINTELLMPESLDFPQVTICNMNPFSKTRSQELGIVDPQTERELQMLSPKLEDFIVEASFNGIPIPIEETDSDSDEQQQPSSNFEWHFSLTDMGGCWTFLTTEKVTRPSIHGGLQVRGYLEQKDYLTSSVLAGINVYVQQPGTRISQQLPFFAVSPGNQAYVSMALTEMDRERQAPWSHCRSRAPEYTQPQCRNECLYTLIREQCSCRLYGDIRTREDASPLKYCPKYNTTSEDYACVDRLLKQEATLFKSTRSCTDCNTKPPCHQLQYDTSLVTTVQHSDQFTNNFDRLYTELSNSTRGSSRQDNTTATLKGYLSNFVSIHVNFGAIQYQRMTESKQTTFAELLSNIGGTMGLFLGISALTLFEVFGDLVGLRVLPRFLPNCRGRQQPHRHLYGVGTVSRRQQQLQQRQ